MIAIMKNEIKDDVRSVFPKVGTEGEFLGTSMRMNHMMVDVRFKLPFVDQFDFLICPADWSEERAEIESAGLNGYMLNGDLRAARYIISAATQLASYAFEDCPREQSIVREQMRRLNKEMFEWGLQIRNRIENGEGNHA